MWFCFAPRFPIDPKLTLGRCSSFLIKEIKQCSARWTNCWFQNSLCEDFLLKYQYMQCFEDQVIKKLTHPCTHCILLLHHLGTRHWSVRLCTNNDTLWPFLLMVIWPKAEKMARWSYFKSLIKKPCKLFRNKFSPAFGVSLPKELHIKSFCGEFRYFHQCQFWI